MIFKWVLLTSGTDQVWIKMNLFPKICDEYKVDMTRANNNHMGH